MARAISLIGRSAGSPGKGSLGVYPAEIGRLKIGRLM